MSGEDSEGARGLYASAERAWQAGDAASAIALLEGLVRAEPAHPNAHNLAGWILRTSLAGMPDALVRAIAHFEAACVHEPENRHALTNLGDALIAAGRDDEAIAAMQAAVAGDDFDVRAHNWLGWYLREKKGDIDAALVHLRRATRSFYGPAHVNLGLALEAKGDLAGAEAAYEQAMLCRDVHDPALVRARLGAFARDRGHLHHALSWFRAAAGHERERKGVRLAEILAAAEAIEDALARKSSYFPHARDEAIWLATADADRHTEGDDPRRDVPTRKAVLGMIDAAQVMLKGRADTATLAAVLASMRALAEPDDLPPQLAGIRLAIDASELEPPTTKRAFTELAHAWTRLHRALYVRLVERAEPTEAQAKRAEVADAIARRDHDAALALLDALAKTDINGLLDCVGLAEHAGDDAHTDARFELAHRYWAFALLAWQFYASCSSSGGEGLARMLDVNRVHAKLAGSADR
jgi:tetratricopeptide (TPR) repeat protein